MKLEEVPDPAAGPGEVVVRVRAAGVNPVDAYIHTGTYPRKPALPYTPGQDGAGEVLSVGADVKDFKAGDRVYICGVGNTVAGAGTGKCPCAECTIPPPTLRGDDIIWSAPSHSRPKTAPTMSMIESSAPTSCR
jgi:NADPH2:quinone reductase